MLTMHEAVHVKSREVLLLVRRKAQSCHVWVQCVLLCALTTLPHAPSTHMNIHKNIMITAGGTEKMREGVQECSQRGLLVQVQIKSAPLKTGGWGEGVCM